MKAKLSEKDKIFKPALEALHEDALRLGVVPMVAPNLIDKIGMIFKYNDVSVHVPKEITDIEALRFIMNNAVQTWQQAYNRGRRDTQLAQLAALGLAVQEDGTVKFGE